MLQSLCWGKPRPDAHMDTCWQHTQSGRELLMNWLLPPSGLVMAFQSQMVSRGSIFFFFFALQIGSAPDRSVQWWFGNDSIYESDNKKDVHRIVQTAQRFLPFSPLMLPRMEKVLLWHEQTAVSLSLLVFCFVFICIAVILLYWF